MKQSKFVSVWGSHIGAAAILFQQVLPSNSDSNQWEPSLKPILQQNPCELTLLELWHGDNQSLTFPLAETIDQWSEAHKISHILVNRIANIRAEEHPVRDILPGYAITVKPDVADFVWVARSQLSDLQKREAIYMGGIFGKAKLLELIRQLDETPHPVVLALLQAVHYESHVALV